MKIVIIGGSSLLGGKLLDKFSSKHQTLGTYFSSTGRSKFYKNIIHLDVTHHEVARRFLIEFDPDVVIYGASIRPDECERNPTLAEAVNYEGLKNIASTCASLGKKIIYLSSDYVFSGEQESSYREDDIPAPINVYGETKAKSEKYLQEHIANYSIVRIPMLYGYSPVTEGRGLLHYLLDCLESGKVVELDNAHPRFPILADNVADLLEYIIQKDETGIFHLSTNEPYTKYEFGLLVCKEYNYDASLIKPITEAEGALPAKRPHKIHLLSERAKISGINIIETKQGISIHKKQNTCLFRMIYSVRPDMLVAGQNASEFRILAGKKVAEENPLPPHIDCVVPIPESGIYSATGVAAQSKVPFIFGIIRDYFTEKTLYSTSTEKRHFSLKRKLIPVESILKGKSIALVDEAVLSGTTLSVVIDKLKSVGVKEIHVRIPSPMMLNGCTGLVLPNNMQLLLKNETTKTKNEIEKELTKKFGVTSFNFLSLKSFLAISNSKHQHCHDCFLSSGN